MLYCKLQGVSLFFVAELGTERHSPEFVVVVVQHEFVVQVVDGCEGFKLVRVAVLARLEVDQQADGAR